MKQPPTQRLKPFIANATWDSKEMVTIVLIEMNAKQCRVKKTRHVKTLSEASSVSVMTDLYATVRYALMKMNAKAKV